MLILSVSGRRQSGKDSACQWLANNADVIWGKTATWAGRQPTRLPTKVKTYHFGAAMKEFCEDYFGVPHEWLWGSNDDKNRHIDILWESLPHYLRLKDAPKGRLTVRQLLQQVGEEMFLDMNPGIWTNAFKKQVMREQPDVALVADARKPEQIFCVKGMGGVNVRLTATKFPEDTHISETALDYCNFGWNNFDLVVDNHGGNEGFKNRSILQYLVDHNLANYDAYDRITKWEV